MITTEIARRVTPWSPLMSDIRYAIRSMIRARAFALGAIATFALGIGVNVAVFSAVDRMLFKPLPYRDPASLAVLAQFLPGESRPYGTIAARDAVEARHLSAVVDLSIASWYSDSYRLSENPDGARYLSFVPVSYNTLNVLGIRPVIGHDFTERDAQDRSRRPVLVSYEVWQRELGGRTDIVGRRVWEQSGKQTAEIIGVLPDGFIPPQVTLPNLEWSGVSVTDDTFATAEPNDRSTPPVVRLSPGVSITAAQAQIDAMVARQVAASPSPPAATASPLMLRPLREVLFGRYQIYVALVFGAASLVLLVGCANLATLLLVRARSREHRAAVQLALGASRARIIRAAVVEALLLALAGCVVSLLVLEAGSHVIAAWLPPLFSRYAAPVFATRVLIFAGVLAAVSAIIAGVLPGWRSAGVDVISLLQRGTNRVGAGRLRGGDVVLAGEIAISVVLVACAALTGRSLVGLLRTDVGFDMQGLHIVSARLPGSKDVSALRQQYLGELEALRMLPGAQVAGADVLPNINARVAKMWSGDTAGGQRWSVTDGFVEAMGMRIHAGRTISPTEFHSAAPVGMLSVAGLRSIWPGVTPQQAIGRFLEFPGEIPREVVGVVSDVRGSYDEPPSPSLYVPLGVERFRSMMYVVRMAPGHTLSVTDVTRQLQQRGYAPTLVDVTPFTDRFNKGVVDQKFRAQLFSAFGATALLLAAIGLYAVQSFSVAMRQTEFGIRLSLGALPRDLWRMLIRQTLGAVMAGIALGLVATYWAAKFLQRFLVLVDARDPWTYAIVAVTLATVAIAAVWLPARRAARTDPAIVLRTQ